MDAHAFDFETVVDRRNTHCEKWDDMEAHFGVSPRDGLALWVADMEFLPPPAVAQSLQKMVQGGVLGYPGDYREYHAAIVGWMQQRHGWAVEPEWIHATHGIVIGINMIVQAFCRPGDKVVLQTPVYYPFFGAVRNNGCQVTVNRLVLDSNGQYVMNFDSLVEQIDAQTRMIILCSPHNPGGRVWRRDELERLAAICLERNVLIVADEIHHDLVYAGHTHTVMASLAPEVAKRTITCTSATKTFNLAGTLTGNVIISDAQLRHQFERQLHRAGMYLPNAFGMMAATAAYAYGGAWLDALKIYLEGNRDMVHSTVRDALPGVTSMPLQGTYLAWLNFSDFCAERGVAMQEVIRRIEKNAKLALNHGETFGPGGEWYMRLNFACARSQLHEALARLQRVLAA